MFKKNKPLVSIVIPIYNVEKHLDKCLKSVIFQTYNNLEVIMVNDGSPDNSKTIASKYLLLDKRFLLINQKNGGLSNARNNGMKTANGKYIYFLDSDDYLNDNSIENMVNIMEKNNLDVGFFNAIVHTNSISSKFHNFKADNEIVTGLKLLKKMIKYKGIYAPVWMYMYKREFLVKNKFDFFEKITHEDEEWTPKVLLKAERVLYANYDVVNYIRHEHSITGNISFNSMLKRYNDFIFILKTLEKRYKKLNSKNEKIFRGYLAKSYMASITRYPEKTSKYIKERDLDFAKRNSISLMMKFIYLIYKFFPKLFRKLLILKQK